MEHIKSWIVIFQFINIILKVIKVRKMLKISTVKPAYNGTARDRTFSVLGGFLLIQVLKVWILWTVKVFR